MISTDQKHEVSEIEIFSSPPLSIKVSFNLLLEYTSLPKVLCELTVEYMFYSMYEDEKISSVNLELNNDLLTTFKNDNVYIFNKRQKWLCIQKIKDITFFNIPRHNMYVHSTDDTKECIYIYYNNLLFIFDEKCILIDEIQMIFDNPFYINNPTYIRIAGVINNTLYFYSLYLDSSHIIQLFDLHNKNFKKPIKFVSAGTNNVQIINNELYILRECNKFIKTDQYGKILYEKTYNGNGIKTFKKFCIIGDELYFCATDNIYIFNIYDNYTRCIKEIDSIIPFFDSNNSVIYFCELYYESSYFCTLYTFSHKRIKLH